MHYESGGKLVSFFIDLECTRKYSWLLLPSSALFQFLTRAFYRKQNLAAFGKTNKKNKVYLYKNKPSKASRPVRLIFCANFPEFPGKLPSQSP